MMGHSLESTSDSKIGSESIEKLKDIDNKIELPDDSGEKRYDSVLPDDSGEKMPEKELTPEEITQKQDEIIQSVESHNTTLETDMEKGNYGEMKVDQDLREKGYQRISVDSTISLDSPTHQGIDGVYHNPDGKPPYLIVDAKYNTAELKKSTGDGPQMCQTWIDRRLDAAVGKEKADEIRMAQLSGDVGCYVGKVAPNNDLSAPVSYIQIDENGNKLKEGVNINAA